MNGLVDEKIEKYAFEHTTQVSPLLLELEKETARLTGNEHMLTGRVMGSFLKMLVRILKAKRVVEVGCFTGYSALMMAEGLPDDGELITCEISEEYASIANNFFRRSPQGTKIRLEKGPAIEALRALSSGSADFIFIDADKQMYESYYEEGLRILRRGGMIAIDNVLWYGTVLSPKDEDARAIVSFNRKVASDLRVEQLLLTVRDGIFLVRKKD